MKRILLMAPLLFAGGAALAQSNNDRSNDRLEELSLDSSTEFMLFGTPFSLAGEYEAVLQQRRDFALTDDAEDDLVQLEQSLMFKLFKRLGENAALYSELSAVAETDLYVQAGDKASNTTLKLDELWLYFNRVLNDRVALQIGRQNISEPREWWWDTEFDALRLFYQYSNGDAELAIAEQQFPNSIEDSAIDPAEDQVMRVLARGAWNWLDEQRLEAFFLYQNDRSATPQPGAIVVADREDNSDADLNWLGVRATGERKFQGNGELNYWLDAAVVHGDETILAFSDDTAGGENQVESLSQRKVRGWGIDFGASWTSPWSGEPTFTLAYARGSGDSNPDDGIDRAFRQTGLGDNNGRFQGVKPFHYYGELLQPELSNLSITTLAVGFPLLQDSTLELVYHRYRQVESAATELGRLDAMTTGASKALGQELDLVLGLEESEGLELELIGSVFEAGDAYGENAGERAYSVYFQLNYSF